MISQLKLSLDSQEFVSDPEKYFRTILVPRLEEALNLKFPKDAVESFLEPITKSSGENL